MQLESIWFSQALHATLYIAMEIAQSSAKTVDDQEGSIVYNQQLDPFLRKRLSIMSYIINSQLRCVWKSV